MQDRQSKSVNSSDISISQSSQLDYAIPASKISTLSSGEFVGVVADNPQEKISLKMFHSEIQNDHAAIAREEKAYKAIPAVRNVSSREVMETYEAIKSHISSLLRSELDNIASSTSVVENLQENDVPKHAKNRRKNSKKNKNIIPRAVSM